MIYKEGINTDILPFNPSGDCEPGGLYFASTDIFAFLDYGSDVYEVEPIGEVYENPSMPKKFKAHSLKMKYIGDWTKDVNVLKYMLDNGADVRAYYDFPLRYASENGYFEIVKYLVENGADIHVENDYALKLTSQNGYLEIVKYLVEQGANIRADNNYALRWASISGYFEVVKFLVEKGADIHADNYYALRWAKTKEIKDYLQKIIIERKTK